MRDHAAIEADLQTFDSAPSGVAVPAGVRLAGDVPALLAAVTRVRELAEQWAAREIYPSGAYEQGMSDMLGNCWDQVVRALGSEDV